MTKPFGLTPYKPRPKHWYRIHITACPLCGRETVERERVYGDKPPLGEGTHEYIERWDGCG